MRYLLVLAAVVAAVAAGPTSAATPKTFVCGQIKNGPHATYTNQVLKKLSGSTWTIFATGAKCSTAMSAAPRILKWWRTAKIESSKTFGRFSCTKESDAHGSAGTAGCFYMGTNGGNIELMMTGKYSIAQVKQAFFIG
jgi:hypothetical protein